MRERGRISLYVRVDMWELVRKQQPEVLLNGRRVGYVDKWEVRAEVSELTMSVVMVGGKVEHMFFLQVHDGSLLGIFVAGGTVSVL